MDSNRLRVIILKLHDRLTNDDRKRLHFYLGNDVPRRIRDDSTLSGTLDLMDSLFDQDKINEQDFTLLIKAFDEIRCYDAARLLKEHRRQTQSNDLNRPIESLALIMPPILGQLLQDQDEDKFATKNLLFNQQNICGDHNTMANSNDTNMNEMSMTASDQVTSRSRSKRKQRFNIPSESFWTCLLLFGLLLIVVFGVLIVLLVRNSNRIEQWETKNNQTIESIGPPKDLFGQLKNNGNTTYVQNGFTIAGGNGIGNGLNQLSYPGGIYVDDDQTMYVADYGNDRIVKWKYNATNGQVVAGGNGPGNDTNQLNLPIDVLVDKRRNDFIICDANNRRVVRWSRQNGQTIISNIDCRALALDNNGNLYVSDTEKHEVRRWKINDTSGTLVAGGNEKGNGLNQLNHPTFIFVDKDYSVYVSDRDNHRVMKWIEGATEGIVVAGGHGEGNSLTHLSSPQGLIVDQWGTVYVADCYNNRMMRWCKGATQGKIVIGGYGEGNQANQLHHPTGLSFDRHENLYVADNDNHRVQRFDIKQN